MQKICVRSFSDNLSSKILAYWYKIILQIIPPDFFDILNSRYPAIIRRAILRGKTGELTGEKTEEAGTHGGGKSSDKV